MLIYVLLSLVDVISTSAPSSCRRGATWSVASRCWRRSTASTAPPVPTGPTRAHRCPGRAPGRRRPVARRPRWRHPKWRSMRPDRWRPANAARRSASRSMFDMLCHIRIVIYIYVLYDIIYICHVHDASPIRCVTSTQHYCLCIKQNNIHTRLGVVSASLDLVFIDGAHDYDSVAQAIREQRK